MATRRRPTEQLPVSPVAQAVEKLKGLNINFLAIDFDCTLISIHTGGCWKGTSEELAGHVRPELVHLIFAALRNNINVAIVTFSSQANVIQEVLEHIFTRKLALQIPIRGSNGRWSYNSYDCKRGKQPHMASAVEELEHQRDGLEITKQTTLLIDDDSRNIRVALQEGVRGLLLNPDKPHLLVWDILRLV